MSFKKFLKDKFLNELATIKNVDDPNALTIAINTYLLKKDINITAEPRLASDIDAIVKNHWDGDWEEFLDAVHRKYLNITTTSEHTFSELQKLMKRQAGKEFFNLLYNLKGNKQPERGKGEIILSILFKNIKEATKKGDVTNGKRMLEIKAAPPSKSGWRPIGSTRNLKGIQPYPILIKKMKHFVDKHELDVDVDKMMSTNAMSINMAKSSEFYKLYEGVMELDKEGKVEFLQMMHQYPEKKIVSKGMADKLSALNATKSIREFRQVLIANHIFSYVLKEGIDSLGIWKEKDMTLLIISHKDLSTYKGVLNAIRKFGIKAAEGPDKKKHTFKLNF